MGKIPTMSKVTPCMKAPTKESTFSKENHQATPIQKMASSSFSNLNTQQRHNAECSMGGIALMLCTKLVRGYFASFNGWMWKRNTFSLYYRHTTNYGG
jgi:hypothetical protein